MLFQHQGLSFRPVEKKDLGEILRLRNEFSTWSQLTDPRPLREGLRNWTEGH